VGQFHGKSRGLPRSSVEPPGGTWMCYWYCRPHHPFRFNWIPQRRLVVSALFVTTDCRHAGLQRGKHDIYDELTFSNHGGYVFHDSGGFECGDNNELEVVQNFVREKSTAKQLRDRLHVIWYSPFLCVSIMG